MKGNKRPYVILSAAMTIDGKIASKSGDPDISDEEDWREVHKLRTQVDAIMVGKGTILKDNPKLHIKYYKHKGYKRIVVDSNLSIPLDSKIITFQPKLYPTIICTTKNLPLKKIKDFESKGVRILQSKGEKKVDILKLLPILYDLGVRKLLLEGGSTLNWSFLKEDLIDEIRLTIGPWMVGGKDAISLVGGEGFDKMLEAPRFSLQQVIKRENYAVLRYIRG
ncbi:MAG: 2,5-diamino-6-(ribosylamino)-4(3H)-pyrimidinone 5'-phosphate reductase [Promethearchaeota archaeon]